MILFVTELTKFSDLRVLDLASNTVSGTIPESIGDLAALEVLDLASTPIHGTLPASLFNQNLKGFSCQIVILEGTCQTTLAMPPACAIFSS
jgi:hypothetical protein